ncbi:alkaline phosphatase family protein, partial [Escherichia coli]|uniref:alkaline phosphatase family protein n=1 Tax=Escherichia coli TaxID=562 RepID=UPI0028DFE986
TIGGGQDRAKVRRYGKYIEDAYRQVDKAVGDILDLTGPDTTVFLVSDHGFAPFHTAVSLTNLLRNEGVDVSKLAIRTS